MNLAISLQTAPPYRHRVSCWLLACAIGSAALWALPAQATERDLGGVKVQGTQTVAGANLRLNGAGIRFRGPFKVYTAALYTEKPAATMDEFHAQTGAKRLVLTMLRDVDSAEMGRLFIRGIEKNITRSEINDVMVNLARMGEIFAANKRLQPGEQLVIDWVPASGMLISVRGKLQSEPVVSSAFFKALMNIWLGASPADWQLKDALLGQTASPPTDRR